MFYPVQPCILANYSAQNDIVTDDKRFSERYPTQNICHEKLTSTAHTFTRNFKHLSPWMDSLVSSTLEAPPQRVNDPSVHRHCTITSDLTHLKKKKFKRKWRKLSPYYVADYDLLLQLKGNHLALALEYMGQQYGVANVEFEQE